MPLQLAVHTAEIVADAIDFPAHAVAAEMVVADFIADPLEIVADALELLAGVAAAAGIGFVFQMAVPLPKAVYIGAIFLAAIMVPIVIVIVIAGHDERGGGKEAGDDAEGKDGLLHKGVVWIREK